MMDFVWDLEKELAHYTAFWGRRHSSGMRHTPDLWNGRADEWDKDLRKNEARQARSHRRVAETVAYLQSRNLLRQEQEIIDIGCGLGRFVAAFARTAGHVTGVDLSDHMAEYGRAYAKAQGVDNVSFQTCDFKTADIDALGWRGRFDLVFASITPAISAPTASTAILSSPVSRWNRACWKMCCMSHPPDIGMVGGSTPCSTCYGCGATIRR